MKKIRIGYIVIVFSAAALVACQKGPVKSIAETGESIENSRSTEEDQIPEGNMGEETGEDTGIRKYIYVPGRFAVYRDGEPHRLMYAANEEYYSYCTFTNLSLPGYGVESISLPSSLLKNPGYIVTQGENLDDVNLQNLDRDVVMDDSAYFSSDSRKIYSLRTPGMYLLHLWTDEYDGNIHTLSLKDFAGLLRIGGSITSDFEDIEILEDGSTRYTCAYKDDREYTGDQVPYYGKAVIRLKGGKAWCGVFAEKDHEDGPRMSNYILKQSITYAEEGEK